MKVIAKIDSTKVLCGESILEIFGILSEKEQVS
jgi:hypothetical protein